MPADSANLSRLPAFTLHYLVERRGKVGARGDGEEGALMHEQIEAEGMGCRYILDRKAVSQRHTKRVTVLRRV